MQKYLFLAQGLYFAVFGIWPLLHYRSFEKVTGPKVDKWLVQTVGLQILASGIVFLYAAQAAPTSREATLLAILNALVFFAVDFYFSLRGRISKIYMVDGVIQLGLLGLWGICLS